MKRPLLLLIGLTIIFMVLGCDTKTKEVPEVPKTLVSGTAEKKIYIQPFIIQTEKDSCRCNYIMENHLGKDIGKLRAFIRVNNFSCDVAHISSQKFQTGTLETSKNLVFGKKCDNISTIKFEYIQDCRLADGTHCKDKDIQLVDSETIQWKR